MFDSWNTDRARIYRRREHLPHDLGTAVNVQVMVFGNAGDSDSRLGSGSGVAFTRDPANGDQVKVDLMSPLFLESSRAPFNIDQIHPERLNQS